MAYEFGRVKFYHVLNHRLVIFVGCQVVRINDKMKLLFDPRLYQILEQSEYYSFEIGIGISFFKMTSCMNVRECVCKSLYERTCMEIRRQLVGVGLSFRHVGPRDQIEVVRFARKCLYLLIYPMSP